LEKGNHGADENEITETETELGREPETRFEKRRSVEQSAKQKRELDETETRLEQIEIEIAFDRHALEIVPFETVRAERQGPLDARQDESPGHGGGRDAARGGRRHGRDPQREQG
jgi:hypothetical protein